ncbi:MAG: Flagellar motor switch protein FliG [Thermodesulfobacteriota bacterium]|nr:Flagellar motor switch protein FliG [Thermodesulfobacteriota bacterium]
MSKTIDPENLNGYQKAAIFLMYMGEEYTTQVFSRMKEQDIGEVAFEMSKVDQITPDMLKVVCADFNVKYEGEPKMIVEGDSFIKNVVTATLKDKEAKAILEDLERKKQARPFIWSRNVNTGTLSAYIQGEHPQTIAMILAHMPAEIASEIMMNLQDELKGDIAMRIARLGQISEDVVRDVDKP